MLTKAGNKTLQNSSHEALLKRGSAFTRNTSRLIKLNLPGRRKKKFSNIVVRSSMSWALAIFLSASKSLSSLRLTDHKLGNIAFPENLNWREIDSTVDLLVWAHFHLENVIYLFPWTSCLSEEVNCTESLPSVSFSCLGVRSPSKGPQNHLGIKTQSRLEILA